MKRTTATPYARRKFGGLIIWRESLIESVKGCQVADIRGVRVGAKQLAQLIQGMPYRDFLLKTGKGVLEIEPMARSFRTGKDGFRHCQFQRMPKRPVTARLKDGQHIPEGAKTVVVIRPKYY